jgi:hypothetical protein
MKRRLRAPSPALVISLIALFVALGGTGYAATHLPKNSVGAKQLKKSAVTSAKIKAGAVTAAKINTAGLTVPSAVHARSADSAADAANATELGGIPPSGYERVQTGTQHYVIPANTLMPQVPQSADYSIKREGPSSATEEFCATDSDFNLSAPIHLPQGATIESMATDYVDDPASAGSDGSVAIERDALFGHGGTDDGLFGGNLPNTPSPGADATATGSVLHAGTNVVDNTKYTYYFAGSQVGGALICGIDVGYTMP